MFAGDRTSRDNPHDGNAKVDRATGTTTVIATRHSFVPVKGYKAMLKMALSLSARPETQILDTFSEEPAHQVLKSGRPPR